MIHWSPQYLTILIFYWYYVAMSKVTDLEHRTFTTNLLQGTSHPMA